MKILVANIKGGEGFWTVGAADPALRSMADADPLAPFTSAVGFVMSVAEFFLPDENAIILQKLQEIQN